MTEHYALLAVLAHPDDESYGPGGTLARYAHSGVDVHVAIATDGAAGSIDEKWQGDRSRLAEARAEELKAATKILGVTLHTLNYRDSGYIGDEANKHPAAFINSDEDEAVCKVVKLIREIRPQVILTHDETGGYFHPDHIQCYKITTAAFYAAGDPEKYPEIGLPSYQPKKLYYSALSNRWIRFMVRLMRLRGIDPTRVGRNKDVDLTRLGVDPARITTRINYRDYWDIKVAAGTEHGSQGGGSSFTRLIPKLLQKLFFANETFMRIYPPPTPGLKEKDFFEGL
ncbi:MAG: PIG-L deacetylase family protein [Candidatus Promineifilaceae bacterium]